MDKHVSTFHPTRRQTEILNAVRLRGTCAVGEIAAELGVSEETIRRDVRPLAAEGLVLKVHGAVVAPDHLREAPFHTRMEENKAEKRRVAARAAQFVKNGESLMLDTGTTTTYLAQALTTHRSLFVVTNSVEAARSLATRNGNRVYMAGGELRADDGAAFGHAATAFARQFRVDTGFLSIAAIDTTNGLLDNELWEAEFSRTVIRQSKRTIVVADHTKFTRDGLVKVCDFDDVDMLVTTEMPPPPIEERLRAANVEVVLA